MAPVSVADHATHTQAPAPAGWPVPRLVQLVVLVLGIALGLSSLAAATMTFQASQAYWIFLGMEMCVALGAGFAILFGRGLFREGPGMALACCAGTILVGGVLGWISVHRGNFDGGMTMKSGKTLSLNALLYGRVGIAVFFGAIGAWLVLSRNRRSGHYLVRALLAGVPLLACAAGAYMMRSSLRGGASWLMWLAATVLTVVIIGLFCACAHFLIRAFEEGRREEVTK